MRLVVLTGGIACGKTTVANTLSNKYKIPIVDSDKITHDLQEPGQRAYKKIVKAFGTDILAEDGHINRKELGKIIFTDPAKRKVLNKIVHPMVFQELFKGAILGWIKRNRVVILDIPLFFEVKLPKIFFQDIITVAASDKVQLERLMKRNNFTEEEAKNRIQSQWPLEQKKEKSTIVINNDGDLEQLEKEVESVIKKWNTPLTLIYGYPDPLIVITIVVLIIALVLKMK